MFLKEMYTLILCLVLSNKHEVWSAMSTKLTRAASSSGDSRITSRELVEGQAKEAFRSLQFERALSCCNKAIEMNPNRVSYFILRGRIHYKLKEQKMALADLRRAILMEPKEKTARMLLCFMLLELGRLDEAKAEIPHIDAFRLGNIGNDFFFKQKFEQAVFCYNAAIEKSPSHPWLLRLRGNCFMKMGKFDESVSDFQKALLGVPGDVDLENNLVKALFLSGRPNEALEKMIDLNGIRAESIAQSLLFELKFDEALLCYTEAIRKDPNKSWYYRARGLCHMKMGNPEAAILDFREALRMNPGLDEVRMLLCETLLDSDGIEEIKEVIRTAKNESSLWLYGLGKKLCREKKLDEAVRWYSLLIELYPGDPTFYSERARCHREMSNVEEANADSELSRQLAPREMTDRINLSELLLESEAYDAAKSVILDIDWSKLTDDDSERLDMICHQIQLNEQRKRMAQPMTRTENTEVVEASETNERMQNT